MADYSFNSFEVLENLTQGNNQIKSSAKKFIEELTHLLEEKNIKRDNIYIMFKARFTWRSLLTKDGKKQIGIHKLIGFLTVIFCTNITGCHKLSPFYFYDCDIPEFLMFFKNIPNLCTSKDERQKIFIDWYNNHFVKLVKEHQQETDLGGRVLSIVNNSEMFHDVHSNEVAENNNFEILSYPRSAAVQQLDHLTRTIRSKCRKASEDFCTSYDMNIYITAISKSWANIESMYIERIWSQILSHFDTKENITETSFVKLTSKFIKNVTEEDTAMKEISAKIEEQYQNTISVAECREKGIPPDGTIKYYNSHEEDEEKEHEEQQENDRNNEKIREERIFNKENISPTFLQLMSDVTNKYIHPDNYTKHFNSPQGIDESECQFESTGSANNVRSIEENLVSSSLTSKLIENVTKEDIAFKEVSAEIEEQRENSRSVEKYRGKDVSPDGTIKYYNSHEEDKVRGHQELLENDRNNKEITDKHTEYFNSLQEEIYGKESLPVKSNGSADNVRCFEEDIESSLLNSHQQEIYNIIESCEMIFDEACLYNFLTNFNCF